MVRDLIIFTNKRLILVTSRAFPARRWKSSPSPTAPSQTLRHRDRGYFRPGFGDENLALRPQPAHRTQVARQSRHCRRAAYLRQLRADLRCQARSSVRRRAAELPCERERTRHPATRILRPGRPCPAAPREPAYAAAERAAANQRSEPPAGLAALVLAGRRRSGAAGADGRPSGRRGRRARGTAQRVHHAGRTRRHPQRHLARTPPPRARVQRGHAAAGRTCIRAPCAKACSKPPTTWRPGSSTWSIWRSTSMPSRTTSSSRATCTACRARLSRCGCAWNASRSPRCATNCSASWTSCSSSSNNLNATVHSGKRAALSLENTLSSLGTVHAQMALLGTRKVDSTGARRLRQDIREEVSSLQDTLEAMDEVQAQRLGLR